MRAKSIARTVDERVDSRQAPTPGRPGTSRDRGSRGSREAPLTPTSARSADPRRKGRLNSWRSLVDRTWDSQSGSQQGNRLFITAKGRSGGGLVDLADLFKGQSAPNTRDKHFAKTIGETAKCFGDFLGIKSAVRSLEPTFSTGGNR